SVSPRLCCSVWAGEYLGSDAAECQIALPPTALSGRRLASICCDYRRGCPRRPPTVSSSAPLDPIDDPTAIAVGRELSPRRGGMRFGLFGSAQARRQDGDPVRGFRDYVDTCAE